MELILGLLSGLRKERKIARNDDSVISILLLAAITEPGIQIALDKNNTNYEVNASAC